MTGKLPPLPASVAAARIPRWDASRLIRRGCPVCGEAASKETLCTRPDDLDVHRCAGCSMLFLPLVPHAEEIARFYHGYSGSKGYLERQVRSRLRFIWQTWSDIRIRILKETGGIYNKDILDVGCASGDFMRKCKMLGAKVSGVEIDSEIREHLRHCGLVAHAHVQSGMQYDVVCAFQVLEHLIDPDSMIKSISQTVRKDGRFVVSMPNAGEVSKVGSGWIGFRVDMEHVNYFDLKSMGRLLNKHGFLIEHYWEHDQPRIARPDETTGSGSFIRKGFNRCLHMIDAVCSGNVLSRGAYVLTVVARKY